MLNITVPFANRNHEGRWMVVGEDGFALCRDSHGREIWAVPSVALQMGGKWTAEELTKEVAKYAKTTGAPGVYNAVASPII